jgi:peptidoglycan hydrolase-like amidase
VPAPCDKQKGRKLWGHGVGMSATEALCMADEKGKNWEEILKYFYKDIELKKRW